MSKFPLAKTSDLKQPHNTALHGLCFCVYNSKILLEFAICIIKEVVNIFIGRIAKNKKF